VEAFSAQPANVRSQMRLVFDGFEIDQDGPRLVRDGTEVPLERRTLDLLCYLAEHPGRLIRKDELIARVWNAQVLSDGVLSNAVAKLRKALGQGSRDRAPIETVHGRGYRFHAVGVVHPQLLAASNAGPSSVDRLIGRALSLQLLEGCLDRVAGGLGQLALITGEAGIGKSRLLEELGRRARVRGFSVWQGVAYSGGAAPAYWPWVEIARAALAETAMRRHLPSDSWAIATLVPELFGAAPAVEDAHALRFRLFDELTRWLAAAASEAPRLILIEDLHWADSASVDLLGHLVRGLERHGVMLAAAVREHELPALQRLLRSAVHVPLHGLSQPEVSQLAGLLAASALDVRTSELLYRRTQGNPLFVRQVLQLFAQRGLPLEAASLETAELPPAVRDVIEQRLAALPVEARSLLQAAAVIGQAFGGTLLARVAGISLDAVLTALEPALTRGLIRSNPAAPHGFEFNHALVRDALYDELGLAHRGGLHAQVARVLSEQSSSFDARWLAEIARHSLLAVPSNLEAMVLHCRRAAAAAREASGFEAAAALLARALDKLAAEGAPGALRCEFLYELGLDLFCAGEVDNGWRALEDGARLALEIGCDPWLRRIAARLASWMRLGGNTLDLAALVEDALARTPETESLHAILLARRAELRVHLARDLRDALYAAAGAHAASAGDPEIMLDVAIARLAQCDPARIADTRAALATYRALEERHPAALLGIQHRLRRVFVELTEYWCALIEGDLESADLAVEQCHAAAEACRVPQLRCAVELLRATRALADHRLDDAAASIERTRTGENVTGGLSYVSMFCSLLLAEAKGDRHELSQLGEQLDLSALDRIALPQRTGACAWLAAFVAKTGQPALARSILRRISDPVLERMPCNYGDLGALCSIAEAYWHLGDATDAEQLYLRLEPYAALNAVGVAYDYKGSVAHYLGMLAMLCKRPAAAVGHLEVALAFNRKLGIERQIERTSELLARASIPA
jgi:DNA-binding winged helix-turn-helix (wHTH) protein